MSSWLTGQKPSVLLRSQGCACFTGHPGQPLLPRMTTDIVILRCMTPVATKTALPGSLTTENTPLGSRRSRNSAGLALPVAVQGPYGLV